MSHKLGICIPYRNRKEHLDKLIPHLSEHLNKQGIEHSFYVANQVDDKLFNRGTMKNIAAKYAFEDGCDYIAWHDVDMLPHEDADYSYPEETPIHIATKLSKYKYKLSYDQYFGGVVLFTKEQVEKTNGYSNDYWDWGQEDDDLFWRCYYEKYTEKKVFKKYRNKHVAIFDGNISHVIAPLNINLDEYLNEDYTISMLFKAEQQPEIAPIWLVGNRIKKFKEYPLLRKIGNWTWGLSFNNSRTVNMTVFDEKNLYHNVWAKKFENEWAWVTVSFKKETNEIYFYVNGDLISNKNDIKENKPYKINENLRMFKSNTPFLIGYCAHSNTFYKGKISEVRITNKHINNVNEIIDNDNDLIFHIDFKNGVIENINNEECEYNITIKKESFEVTNSILPFRKEGSFECMEHIDEGYVNGRWVKGETTAKNEKRFVTEMQQGLIDYKKDGINNLEFELVNLDKISYNYYIINVKL
jgi:hypothetical protein